MVLKQRYVILLLMLFSVVWFTFFLGGLNFNPTWGDDGRGMYRANNVSYATLVSYLFQPVENISHGYERIRPIYFTLIKVMNDLFGSESTPQYFFRILSIIIFTLIFFTLTYLVLQDYFYATATTLTVLTLPQFFLTIMWTADTWIVAEIFLQAALIILIFIYKKEKPSKSLFIAFFILSFLGIKTKSSVALILPIFAFSYILLGKQFRQKWNKPLLVAALIFLFILAIPIKNLFQKETNGSLEQQPERNYLNILSHFLIKQTYEEPYGQELAFVLFRPPFSLQPNYPTPMSFLGGLGTLLSWLLVICIATLIIKKTKNKLPKTKNPTLYILITWTLLSWISLLIIAGASETVHFPRYSIVAFTPTIILTFYLIQRTESTISKKTTLRTILILIIILNILIGAKHAYTIRSIEGETWHAFDTASRIIYQEKFNKTPNNPLQIYYSNGPENEYQFYEDIIFEHYNFVITPVQGQGNIKDILKKHRHLYFIDFEAYPNDYYNILKIIPNTTEKVISYIYPCTGNPFCTTKQLKRKLTKQQNKPIATIKKLEVNV